jgi:hypothetical protein
MARYKRDYKKWGKFKAWLFQEDESDRRKQPHETAEGRKKRCVVNALRKRRMFLEMGPNLESFGGDGTLLTFVEVI